MAIHFFIFLFCVRNKLPYAQSEHTSLGSKGCSEAESWTADICPQQSGSVHDSLLLSVQMPQRIRLKLINGCYYNSTHPNQTCHISRGTLLCFHCVCVCAILEEGSITEMKEHIEAHRDVIKSGWFIDWFAGVPSHQFPNTVQSWERERAAVLCETTGTNLVLLKTPTIMS